MNDNTPRLEEEEDFAAMLEESYKEPSRMEPGQKIEADIIKITKEHALLQVGGKGEGYVDRKELEDNDGLLLVKEGDRIRAYFIYSKDGEMHFTTRIGTGPAARAQLQDACREHIPVEGTIAREIKGGFEVTLNGGARAFCPFSHMGLRREENKADYVGTAMTFHVLECTGRGTVLTRKEMVEAERRERMEALKSTLSVGVKVRGVITSIQKFGAFVDIGGVEGLLPISEMAWDRTEKVSDRVAVNQPVEVIIKNLDWENRRISLSLKDTLPNPWDTAHLTWPPGSFHKGKVSRLAPFGAFVTLAPGVDGLIHVSRMSAEKRVNHPEEVLAPGQEVEVRVEKVESSSNRISLSLASISREQDEERDTMRRYQHEGETEAPMGTLAEALRKAQDGSK
jgi:small subunit ribosomal protein S1